MTNLKAKVMIEYRKSWFAAADMKHTWLIDAPSSAQLKKKDLVKLIKREISAFQILDIIKYKLPWHVFSFRCELH